MTGLVLPLSRFGDSSLPGSQPPAPGIRWANHDANEMGNQLWSTLNFDLQATNWKRRTKELDANTFEPQKYLPWESGSPIKSSISSHQSFSFHLCQHHLTNLKWHHTWPFYWGTIRLHFTSAWPQTQLLWALAAPPGHHGSPSRPRLENPRSFDSKKWPQKIGLFNGKPKVRRGTPVPRSYESYVEMTRTIPTTPTYFVFFFVHYLPLAHVDAAQHTFWEYKLSVAFHGKKNRSEHPTSTLFIALSHGAKSFHP